MAMQDFANQQNFSDALGVMVQVFSGGAPSNPKIAQAAINIISFGMGQIVTGGNPPMLAADDTDKAAFLRGIKAMVDEQRTGGLEAFPWASIPWAQLIAIAIQVISQYVPWFPIPKPPVPVPVPPVPTPGIAVVESSEPFVLGQKPAKEDKSKIV